MSRYHSTRHARGASVALTRFGNPPVDQDQVAARLEVLGQKFRVRRRRRDTNVRFAEKIQSAIERRLHATRTHVGDLLELAMQCDGLLALARSLEHSATNKQEVAP